MVNIKNTIENLVSEYNKKYSQHPIVVFDFVSLDNEGKLMWWTYNIEEVNEGYKKFVLDFIGTGDSKKTLIKTEYDRDTFSYFELGNSALITDVKSKIFKFAKLPDPIGIDDNFNNTLPDRDVIEAYEKLFKEKFKNGSTIWVSLPHTDNKNRKVYSAIFALLNYKIDNKQNQLETYRTFRDFIVTYLIELYKAPIENEKQILAEQVIHYTQYGSEFVNKLITDNPDHYISAKIASILEAFKYAILQDIPILIHGETGTGKEHIANAIHKMSKRPELDYIALNCAGFYDQSNIIDAELFGYKKEVIQGKKEDKDGFFKTYSKGTIFLDEIQQMPIAIQKKLKRVIEYKKFFPMGATKEEDSNARLIFATNRNLPELVREEKFLDDLFYRINIITIKIPTLRERKDEIIPLINKFLKDFNDKYSPSKNKSLDNQALNELKNYNYPGNIRELRSTILRAFMLSGDKEKIKTEHLIFDGIQYKLDEVALNTGSDTSPEMEKVKNVIQRMISATKDSNIDKGKRKKLTGQQMLTSEYLPESTYGTFDNLKKTYLKPNKEKIKTLILLNPSLNIGFLPGIKTSIK